MKNIRLRKLLKFNSAKLRKANWDLKIQLSEAKKNNELVALAESTVLRFIDTLNGVNSNEIYERQRELKRRASAVSALPSSKETKAQMRAIRNEINTLLYIPELVMLVIDREKDYWDAIKGFKVNGRTYHRLMATSAGVKLRTVIFADDTVLNELSRLLDNGRDMNKAMVPAKLESYKGLAMSASTPVSTPVGVVVVKDCVTHFVDDYIQLSDGNPEPHMEVIRGGDIELDNSDGYGLISPEMAEIWSAELSLPETASGFCVRNAFCKGMLFPFDFKRFASDVAHNYEIVDVWGNKHNILDVDIILTESQLKLWDSYESMDEYMRNCLENGYTFSVTKTADAHLKESRELNYQFIQSYQLTDDEIRELIQPTIDDIAGVMGGDAAKAILYLKGTEMTEKSVRKLEDDCVKALMINHDVLNDPYVRSYISRLISKRGDRAKLGRVRVRGDYMIVSGDPYALCQSMFGMNVTGLLKAGEVYAQYWIDRGVDRVACFRAPMTIHNNIRAMNVCGDDSMRDWYQHMGSIFIINAWDMMASSLNGMDMDGDTVLSTDNRVLLNNTRNELPISCQQRKAEKIVATEHDMVAANLIAFGDSSSSIGSITNRATEMWDKLSRYEPGSDEWEILSYRLTCSQHYQQNSIDRAKGIISEPMPTYWHNKAAAIKADSDGGIEIFSEIVADKKPYFMRYRYDDTNRQWTKYSKKCEFDCAWKFGCSPGELMLKEELSEEEATYLMWYHKNSPVSMGNCVMNRLCWMTEKLLSDIRNEWTKSVRSFSYMMYRTDGIVYSPAEFNAIRKILDDYAAELKSLPAYAKANNMEDSSVSEYKQALLESVRQDCYCNCSNGETLCNIVLDYIYSKKKGSQLVWDICGDVVVRNLLRISGGVITYYEASYDGVIDYKGQMFVEREVNLFDENDEVRDVSDNE